ncbi:MAG TPA: DUF1573 domain-containing protein [Thermoanaerobaculia bacterium]|nr:DUF1573 domain-containing protein [Thermoanaerobaculia bacterium]
MSDFETMNLKRGGRELEILRAHYRRHRVKLDELIADAPTEVLAGEYRALIQEIDNALFKLDEIESSPRLRTEPGLHPLVTSAPPQFEEADTDARSRLVLIAVAAVVALAVIGWFIWRASSDRREPPAIVDSTTAAPATIAEEPPVTPAPPASNVLSVSPASASYGAIRKGTRATRQFEVTNNSDEPVSIALARSACRCLYYEYNELVPPKGKESVTVTVDGAKASAGELRETLKITSKRDPSIVTSFDVTATIR